MESNNRSDRRCCGREWDRFDLPGQGDLECCNSYTDSGTANLYVCIDARCFDQLDCDTRTIGRGDDCHACAVIVRYHHCDRRTGGCVDPRESGEIGDDDNGPPSGLTMRDFDINVTDEYIELIGQASSSSFGDIDFHVVGVPMVEDGELNFHVTAATVNGIPLPRNMISQMEGGFDQMLLQSLSGGYEV